MVSSKRKGKKVSSKRKDIELVENKVNNQKGELMTNFVPLKDDGAAVHESSQVNNQKGELVTNFVPLEDDGAVVHASGLDQRNDPIVKPSFDENDREVASDVKEDEAVIANVASVEVDEEVAYAKHLAEDGPLFFKIPAFLGGVAMIFSSILDFFFDMRFIGIFPSLDFTITSFYIFTFGLFICVLEGNAVRINIPAVHEFVRNYMRILQLMWGRGLLYIFSGSLSYCLLSDYSVVCGIYMMCLGTATLIGGIFYNRNLEEQNNLEPDVMDLEAKFALYDADQDGLLDENGFREVVVSAEGLVQWEDMDFEAEFSKIDKDGDGRISFSDLQVWLEEVQTTQQNPAELV